MKRLAKLTAVVLALTVLAPVLAPAETEGLPTILIIHKSRTLAIPLVALPGHLWHGDKLLGPCCL